MATMKELAAEYRVSAAKLSMRIAELRAAGVSPEDERLAILITMLRQTREIHQLLDGYYELPHHEHISMTGLRARRCKDDH